MADLITLEDYKLMNGISSPNKDTELEIIISGISELVKNYCNNSFIDYYTSDKTEYKTLTIKTDLLFLNENPIISITSIDERPTALSDYVTLVENVDFSVDEEAGLVYRLGSDWAMGPKAIQVVYKAGYSEIPSDLKLAVADLITYYHKTEYRHSFNLNGISVQNSSSSKLTGYVGFPDHIKRVLDMYRAG